LETSTFMEGHRCICGFEENWSASVINALPAHIAILDEQGFIIDTNRAWQMFAEREKVEGAGGFKGVNYLHVCDTARGEGIEDAWAVATGIREVIRRESQGFLCTYPCHSPSKRRWFSMRAVRMEYAGLVRVVVSHEDVTELKAAQEALMESKAALEGLNQQLKESNIALKVLLQQRQADQIELEQKFLANIKELVLPYIEKLKKAPLRMKDKNRVEIIENHLSSIISPLIQRLANMHIILTPQELQIASLIKTGRSSKDIAGILGSSVATVHFHRKNLRLKFGLKNAGKNLRTHLMSIA
jgi:DNA-binding CsgD family transcriptional regulator